MTAPVKIQALCLVVVSLCALGLWLLYGRTGGRKP